MGSKAQHTSVARVAKAPASLASNPTGSQGLHGVNPEGLLSEPRKGLGVDPAVLGSERCNEGSDPMERPQ